MLGVAWDGCRGNPPQHPPLNAGARFLADHGGGDVPGSLCSDVTGGGLLWWAATAGMSGSLQLTGA